MYPVFKIQIIVILFNEYFIVKVIKFKELASF